MQIVPTRAPSSADLLGFKNNNKTVLAKPLQILNKMLPGLPGDNALKLLPYLPILLEEVEIAQGAFLRLP